MQKVKGTKEIIHGVDEVKFKNHISEFKRFYSAHKSFCDEVAGIKPRLFKEKSEAEEFFIGKKNFIFAIRKLLAFVIDNLHYVKNVGDRRMLESACYKLEQDFIDDKVYHEIASKKTKTAEEEIVLTKKYLEYIMRIYATGNKLTNLLQNSIMISTSRVAKHIEYYNEGNFFDELSIYRSEISDSISNYRFSDTLDQLKRILGYHYTYKILLDYEDQKFTEDLLLALIDEILKEDILKLITKVANSQYLTDEEKKSMTEYHSSIKKALLKIYYITNMGLSERKILPKIERKIHIDKTLI